MTPCSYPGCPRPAYRDGSAPTSPNRYCAGHRAQIYRGTPLRPLRGPGDEPRQVVQLSVSRPAAERVRADKPGARAALERWATEQ